MSFKKSWYSPPPLIYGGHQSNCGWFQVLLCLLAAFSLCQGGNKYATVFNLPARRQPHSVFKAFVHAGTICPFMDPGSFTSVHDLKCMRTQTAPLFNAPRGRWGNRAQVPFPRIHPVTWTGFEPTTLGLWVHGPVFRSRFSDSHLSKQYFSRIKRKGVAFYEVLCQHFVLRYWWLQLSKKVRQNEQKHFNLPLAQAVQAQPAPHLQSSPQPHASCLHDKVQPGIK